MTSDDPLDAGRRPDRLPPEALLNADVVSYGPDIPDESDLRLLGDLKGRRVLELGCGWGQCSVAFAKQGAIAIGVDPSSEQLARTRRLIEREEVRVELRQGDLAELAFLRADSVDLAFSAHAFDQVEDLNRVFRQVHRVLRVGAPLVFSLPHPAFAFVERGTAGRPDGAGSYFDGSAVSAGEGAPRRHHHRFEEIFGGLTRASYRVDALLEPEPRPMGPRSPEWTETMLRFPPTLIVRARKEGS